MKQHAGGSQQKAAVCRPVVMVVDDDILLRSAVAEYLRESGYAVVEAANADEAIAVLASGDPVDVVFSDIRMPGTVDGLGLARWIYQHSPGPQVMLTSGDRGESQFAEFIATGFFLSKPYRLAEAANRIRTLLEQGGRQAF
jgi:CheY-like chemotaxis protein